MKQQIEQQQKMSTELSYKMMQLGELIFQIEDEYMHVFGRDTREKVKHAANLIREISEEMEDRHVERMNSFRERVRINTQQGFL